MLLQTFQQLSGINAIMFYAPIIFDDFFGNKGGIYGSLALNVINFFSTFITMATIEKFGRVKILFSGGILMCFALIVTASLSGVDEAHAGDVANQSLGIGIIVFCALYVIGFAYSWGPVVWVVCAEMFPMRERGKANSLSTFSNWCELSFFVHILCTSFFELTLYYHLSSISLDHNRRISIPHGFYCKFNCLLHLLRCLRLYCYLVCLLLPPRDC